MISEFVYRSPELLDPDTTIEVEMGEFSCAPEGKIIYTEGLGPCVGIALFDSSIRKGYLLHTLGANLEDVHDFLGFVNDDCANPGDIKGWVNGGQVRRGEYKSIRSEVVDMLNRFGILNENLVIDWSENGDESVSMQLDTTKGTCSLEVNSTLDYDH